jgi:hypothetical protein
VGKLFDGLHMLERTKALVRHSHNKRITRRSFYCLTTTTTTDNDDDEEEEDGDYDYDYD